MTRLGYNTNGFANHSLKDAVAIPVHIGYESVAITLERDLLDPPDAGGVDNAVRRLAPLVEKAGVSVTIETGARFILDQQCKHQPTLISHAGEDRRRRTDFLKAAVDISAAVSAESVSLWSGSADDDANEDELLERLTVGLGEVLDHAESKNVRLSFEPEPGMFIDTMDRFEQLHARIAYPLLGLTLDVGHVHCLGDGEVAEHVRRWRDVLWNVHIEDMCRSVHEHLMFGEGEMDFAPIFDALREIDYTGPVQVELPRHSHDAVNTARRSFEFLQRFL